MERIFSTILIIALLIFDSLEPVLRKKNSYFSIKVDEEESNDRSIYKDYLKKVFLITLPIGIFLWYYYPIESNIFAFLCGFLVMVLLNLLFYFIARKEIKSLFKKKD